MSQMIEQQPVILISDYSIMRWCEQDTFTAGIILINRIITNACRVFNAAAVITPVHLDPCYHWNQWMFHRFHPLYNVWLVTYYHCNHWMRHTVRMQSRWFQRHSLAIQILCMPDVFSCNHHVHYRTCESETMFQLAFSVSVRHTDEFIFHFL